MSHNFETEDARIAAAKVAGRDVATYEIGMGHTEPRSWERDGDPFARVYSHLAAAGFTRFGARSYAITFRDEYVAEFYRLRLEFLRGRIVAESISQGELIELQGLAEHIQPGDVQLLEWAGVPEFPEEEPNYEELARNWVIAHGTVWPDDSGVDLMDEFEVELTEEQLDRIANMVQSAKVTVEFPAPLAQWEIDLLNNDK